MIAGNRFWLSLHHLSRDYMDEGDTPERRVRSIIEEFELMPAIAQRELLADLAPLAACLADVYTLATVAHRETKCEAAKAG